ncbi:unnamed protein product [Meganyctiphanes norvegica]|uniref:Uncharacterized protein n=1 Tax=Meganyctiphanes norvegica TaxID=48144 RepID=A0AAV2QML3_MEGNR
MIKYILTLLSCISVTWSHTLHWGRTCPDVPPVPNLDLNRILGSWYVLYKSDTDNSCMKWDLTNTSHPDHLLLKETRQLSFLETFGIDHTQTIDAELHIPNPEVPAKMRIRWPTSWTGAADFIIFDTDYDTYVAVSECDRAGFFHRRSAAILARTNDIDELLVRRIGRLLSNADAGNHDLDSIQQTGCHGNGTRNYHVDTKLFGLLPDTEENGNLRHIGSGVEDYDISQLEIIGDGVQPVEEIR